MPTDVLNWYNSASPAHHSIAQKHSLVRISRTERNAAGLVAVRNAEVAGKGRVPAIASLT